MSIYIACICRQICWHMYMMWTRLASVAASAWVDVARHAAFVGSIVLFMTRTAHYNYMQISSGSLGTSYFASMYSICIVTAV